MTTQSYGITLQPVLANEAIDGQHGPGDPISGRRNLRSPAIIRERVPIMVEMTPAYVEWFSQLPTLCGDRGCRTKEDQKHVSFLHRRLNDGLFITPVWSTCEMRGVTYRVDGGRSSWVLTQLGDKLPKGRKILVRQFECDSPDDMVTLSDQFDHRTQTRTFADRIRAHASREPKLAGVSAAVVRDCVAGVTSYLAGWDCKVSLDDDARVRLMHEHSDFIGWARPILTRNLRHRPALAAMFATFRDDREAAAEFWKLVAQESHPDRTHLTRELGIHLSSVKSCRSGTIHLGRSRRLYRTCMKTWAEWKSEPGQLMHTENPGHQLPW